MLSAAPRFPQSHLLTLAHVRRGALWAADSEPFRALADAGLIAARGSAGGYVWACTPAGLRVLATAGGVLRTLRIAESRWAPALQVAA